jgi:Flp pilus assembly protein TadD
MRTSLAVTAPLLLTLLVAPLASAQVRGNGRIEGTVVAKATGKPIADATITVSRNTKPVTTKTNGKGKWSVLGLVGGDWTVDIEAKGFRTLHVITTVNESGDLPPLRSELVAGADEALTNISPDVMSAVNKAQDLMSAMEGDPIDGGGTVTAETVKENSRKAGALLEAALPQIVGQTAERRFLRMQVLQLLAQAHLSGGDNARAVETLQALVAADETNSANTMQLVNLYLETGKLAEGKALLEKLPEGAITDPIVYLNAGISFLNAERAADAQMFFDKAVALDASKAESYYYRGLARLQLKNTAEAKADLEKVLELAPNGAEAGEVRQLLAGLK